MVNLLSMEIKALIKFDVNIVHVYIFHCITVLG